MYMYVHTLVCKNHVSKNPTPGGRMPFAFLPFLCFISVVLPHVRKYLLAVSPSGSRANANAHCCGRAHMVPQINEGRCVHIHSWRIFGTYSVVGIREQDTGFGNMWFALKMSESVRTLDLVVIVEQVRGTKWNASHHAAKFQKKNQRLIAL